MMDMPVIMTITRQQTPGASEIVRIECKDHFTVVARLDMSMSDFSLALLGQEITAAFSPVKTP